MDRSRLSWSETISSETSFAVSRGKGTTFRRWFRRRELLENDEDIGRLFRTKESQIYNGLDRYQFYLLEFYLYCEFLPFIDCFKKEDKKKQINGQQCYRVN